MNEVAAIVEGPTEEAFVRGILAPHLTLKGISLWATLPGHPRRQGGVPRWELARKDIMRTLKERDGRYVTTMFDFFRMPPGWPGRVEASAKPWNQIGQVVEKALLDDVSEHMGDDFRTERFIPYVQVHEFEAVLFSDVEKLSSVLSVVPGVSAKSLKDKLQRIVDRAENPEAIDDCPATAPSKRILSLAPGYSKRQHGPIAARSIGLPTMRAACPNFNQWLSRLEEIGR